MFPKTCLVEDLAAAAARTAEGHHPALWTGLSINCVVQSHAPTVTWGTAHTAKRRCLARPGRGLAGARPLTDRYPFLDVGDKAWPAEESGTEKVKANQISTPDESEMSAIPPARTAAT